MPRAPRTPSKATSRPEPPADRKPPAPAAAQDPPPASEPPEAPAEAPPEPKGSGRGKRSLPAPPAAAASTPTAPSEAPPAAAAPPASEKPKGKRYKPKPPIPLPDPQNADELLALNLRAVDRLSYEVTLRTGRARRRRTDLLRRKDPDLNALQGANGQLAWLGALQSVLMQRRTQLRVEARQAQGKALDRAEAIAVAVDRLVNGPLHARLMREADQILQQAAKDLERDLQAPQPESPLLKD